MQRLVDCASLLRDDWADDTSRLVVLFRIIGPMFWTWFEPVPRGLLGSFTLRELGWRGAI